MFAFLRLLRSNFAEHKQSIAHLPNLASLGYTLAEREHHSWTVERKSEAKAILLAMQMASDNG